MYESMNENFIYVSMYLNSIWTVKDLKGSDKL